MGGQLPSEGAWVVNGPVPQRSPTSGKPRAVAARVRRSTWGRVPRCCADLKLGTPVPVVDRLGSGTDEQTAAGDRHPVWAFDNGPSVGIHRHERDVPDKRSTEFPTSASSSSLDNSDLLAEPKGLARNAFKW